jgi:beta-1,4-galactosyltransferase 4
MGLLYHETLINQLDKFTMPDSSELCKIAPEELLQRLRINEEEHIVDIEKRLKNTPLQHGGKYRPSLKSIRSKNKKLAIIVPYRDRLVNLEILLKNIHPFLMQQNIYYSIYLVEPIGNLTFNKGISMNAGYLEAIKEDDYDCFIFHDVDMVPEDLRNYYECNERVPKLLASAISAFGYSTEGYFKDKYFGGVTAFTREQFAHVNGFSNSYFGWGLEDDDARER